MIYDGIHPTAIIHDSVELGEGTTVGPFTCIGVGVKLGKNNRIASHVVIEGDTHLGDDNQIFSFASVGTTPQDLKFKGGKSELRIGNGNRIREYVSIQPGLEQFGGITSIGNNNLFMANSHVAHDCHVGNNIWMTNSAALAGHVTLEDNVIMAGLSGVHQFCRIGEGAFIAAGAMVTHDVPPFCMAQGDRAKLRTINKLGLERKGYSHDEVRRIFKIFTLLFVNKGTMEEKLAVLQKDHGDFTPAQKLKTFIEHSQRGLITYQKDRAENAA